MTEQALKKEPSSLLCYFVYGSMLLLLGCLSWVSFHFSNAFIEKERLRAKNFTEMVTQSFDLHYTQMTEEMWTHSYKSINLRVQTVVNHLTKSKYSLVLADALGNCVYSAEGDKDENLGGSKESQTPALTDTPGCQMPERFKLQIHKFNPESVEANIDFDALLDRYIYTAPLYVGNALQGYLFATLVDPYEFYRGTQWALIMKIFLVPFSFIFLAWCVWLVVSYSWILRPYLSMIIGMKRKEAVANLALQVAHDIRSPSVALNSVVKNLNGIGSAQRRVLTLAASRVENIANDLLKQFVSEAKCETAFCFVAPAIEAISSEKRAVLGEDSKIEVLIDASVEVHCAAISITETEFSRVLSNLLNNAIDALEEAEVMNPKVWIRAKLVGERASIAIEDNGPGLPADVLHRIQISGGSYGKPGGNGLGLQHAKEVLAKAHGALAIDSKVGSGTVVSMDLPLVAVPSWCLQMLDLSGAQAAVVLDDDESVHALWRERLGQVRAYYLSDPSELKPSDYPHDTTQYLIDFDLGKGRPTGLDIVSQFGLQGHAVICTNNFADEVIQKRAEELRCQILPKFMLSSIAIVLPTGANGGRPDSGADKSKVGIPAPSMVVLIDDDPIIRDLWEMDASSAGIRVLALESFDASEFATITKDVPIFVDKNLGQGVSGFDVIKDLQEKGYQQVILTTGEKLSKADLPAFVKEVRNKDFPFQA